MPQLAVDYSFARPSPATIKAQGYTAVGRYLGGGASKDISKAEAAALHAAGLSIFLVYETVATRATSGTPGGRADAQSALMSADLVGYPASCPIFFGVDFNARSETVRPYIEGIHGVLGERTGVYGSFEITVAMRDLAPYRWQTCAWSGTSVDPEAHLYQRLRPTVDHPIVNTDEDVILRPFPMWEPASPKAAPQPAPAAVTWTQWPATVEMRRGAKGASVRVLQTAMRDSRLRGVRGIKVDGDFGPQTDTALRNFQLHAFGKKGVDGIAGPETRAALIALGDVH